jgi:hypothetical protein
MFVLLWRPGEPGTIHFAEVQIARSIQEVGSVATTVGRTRHLAEVRQARERIGGLLQGTAGGESKWLTQTLHIPEHHLN